MEPETLTAAPAPAPDAEDAPVRTCPTCGSGLLADQDWCLECGTARPDRLRGFPGARTAVAVLATSGVLASGAVAAAYAGLQGTPQPTPQLQASARTPGSTPPAATTPPQGTTPGATTPSSATPPAVTPPIAGPMATPFAPTAPGASPSAATPPAGGAATPAHGSGGSSGSSGSGPKASKPHAASPHRAPRSGGGSAGSTTSTPVRVTLSSSAASVYNPNNVSSSNFPDPPSQAIDGKSSTAWTAKIADGSVGLDLALAKPLSPQSIVIRSTSRTRNFGVYVYGTASADKPSKLSGWTKLTPEEYFVNGSQSIDLSGKGLRHVMVWLADPSGSGPISLSELELYR